MTARVPVCAIAIMVGLLVTSLAIGIANDTGSISIPDFTLNLVSSITAFSASGLFATAIVNRYVRRRYQGVELDRRVAAIVRLEALVHEVAEALDIQIEREASSGEEAYPSMSERALGRLRSGIEVRQMEISSATTREALSACLREATKKRTVTGPERPGALIADQLEFVSDAKLLYATDRLDVKLSHFRNTLALWHTSDDPASYPTVLRAALSATKAVGDVIDWLVAAPSERMVYAVRNKLRHSEVRQELLPD